MTAPAVWWAGAPRLADVAELVRLSAVLTVPGDVLAGRMASADGPAPGPLPTAGLAASSGLLYLAGMALNDYADRGLDATERPERPIPSGRVSPRAALGIAAGLTAGAVTLAALAGGRSALRVTVPLVGVVWSYDLALKDGPWGVPAMAAARSLDVALGGGGRAVDTVAAGLVGAHTALVTALSRQENHGSSRRMCSGTFVGHLVVAVGAAATSARGKPGQCHPGTGARAGIDTLAATLLSAAYVATIARGHRTAAADPRPANVKRAVGGGITALPLLQALLSLRRAPRAVTTALALLQPAGRLLARRRSVT